MDYSPALFNNDYRKLKERITEFYSTGEIEKCLKLISIVGRAAYKYRFDKMYDAELESTLDEISAEFLPSILFHPIKNKLVFLDSFCWDNKGLTEQYIDALISLNYEILMIVTTDAFHNKGLRIINKLKSYQRGSFKIYGKGECLTISKAILNDIRAFRPERVLFHPSPWDVIAMIVLRKLEGVSERIFIDITDNHFWLGINTFDTLISFRAYGRSFCRSFRHIDQNKIRLLPYYPVVENSNDFEGLPIERKEDSFIAISGGNGYKFLGGDNIYIRLVFIVVFFV